MKKILMIQIILVFSTLSFSQEIECIQKIDKLKFSSKGAYEAYSSIYTDEVNEEIYIYNGKHTQSWKLNINNNKLELISEEKLFSGEFLYKLRNYYISYSDGNLYIYKDEKLISRIKNPEFNSGICFILKKENEYCIFFYDKEGKPGAVDTKGKKYSNLEAMKILKEYDVKKYNEGMIYAEEKGILNRFNKSEILIWDNTCFIPSKIQKEIYGNYLYAFPYPALYDVNGNCYQIHYDENGKLYLIVNHNNECLIKMENLLNDSVVQKEITERQHGTIISNFSISLSGNVYFYAAGEEYTEAFRIRRTWGDPDFYAMAVNGYTDDEYGKYVDEVLPKLSKEELRLLRNTIFALYGVHFKSEDLNKHFDKQVWYTDGGKASGEIELPAHRQKLVEMIQALEK